MQNPYSYRNVPGTVPAVPPRPYYIDAGPPNRGTLALVLGIVGLVFSVVGWLSCLAFPAFLVVPALAGLILSVPAWVVAQKDLSGISQGRLSQHGRGSCQAGLICGVLGTVLSAMMLIVALILLVVVMAFLGFVLGSA